MKDRQNCHYVLDEGLEENKKIKKKKKKKLPNDFYLILGSVQVGHNCMGQYHVVCCHKRLSLRIPFRTVPERFRAPRWRESARTVSQDRLDIRLIEGHPVLDSVSKELET